MTGGSTADGGPQTAVWSYRTVVLRDLQAGDLDIFFVQQQDPAGVHMAAFTTPNPDSRPEFDDLWTNLQQDPDVLIKTILAGGQVAGHVLTHTWHGPLEVSYWLGREFWGQGIMTAALKTFLKIQVSRPLFARTAQDNLGSLRVLEKCGFVHTDRVHRYAHGRKDTVVCMVMKLD